MSDVISDLTSCYVIHDILNIIDIVIFNSNPDLTIKITFFGCHDNRVIAMETNTLRHFLELPPTFMPSLVKIGP